MPKRVVDGEALWRSSKLAKLAPQEKPEYANLLPLALSNGSFECDARLVWSRVYVFNRPEVTLEAVETLLDSLERVKLLFRWNDEDGRPWGYWIGIDKPGRLPSPARRGTNEIIGKQPPADLLSNFLSGTDLRTDASRIHMDAACIHAQGTAEIAEANTPLTPTPERTDATCIHTDANGCSVRLGLGLGLGSGLGSGDIHSAAPASQPQSFEYEPIPEEDDEQWTRELAQLHPSLENPEETYRAIFDALGAVMRDRKMTKAEAKAHLWQRTKQYQEITAEYPEEQKKYIKGSHTWFRNGCYNEDESVWLRRGRGNTNGNGSANKAEQRQRGNLAALEQFTATVEQRSSESDRPAVSSDGGGVWRIPDGCQDGGLHAGALGRRRRSAE